MIYIYIYIHIYIHMLLNLCLYFIPNYTVILFAGYFTSVVRFCAMSTRLDYIREDLLTPRALVAMIADFLTRKSLSLAQIFCVEHNGRMVFSMGNQDPK